MSRIHARHVGADPSRSVYINGPYGDEHADFFDALVFAIVCAGFRPRCADEGGVAIPRDQRIDDAISSSRHSISYLVPHRENLIDEFGLVRKRPGHDWLALVPSESFQRDHLSNLSGYDLPVCPTKEKLVAISMSWLVERNGRSGASLGVSPKHVIDALPVFEEYKRKFVEYWFGEVPWRFVVGLASKVARESGLIGESPA